MNTNNATLPKIDADLKARWIAEMLSGNWSRNISRMLVPGTNMACPLGILLTMLAPDRAKRGGYVGDVFIQNGLNEIMPAVVAANNASKKSDFKEVAEWVNTNL